MVVHLHVAKSAGSSFATYSALAFDGVLFLDVPELDYPENVEFTRQKKFWGRVNETRNKPFQDHGLFKSAEVRRCRLTSSC